MRLEFRISGKLSSLANTREHWGAAKTRAAKQRLAGAVACSNALLAWRLKQPKGQDATPFPLRVLIVRYGPRKLDTDNLAISAKHVRDGVADALGIDDADERVAWRVEQEPCKKYGARVVVESC